MDEQLRVARRDLKRDFQVNRHSSSAIAKAFQLVDADQSSDQPFDASEHAAQRNSPMRQLQESQ